MYRGWITCRHIRDVSKIPSAKETQLSSASHSRMISKWQYLIVAIYSPTRVEIGGVCELSKRCHPIFATHHQRITTSGIGLELLHWNEINGKRRLEHVWKWAYVSFPKRALMYHYQNRSRPKSHRFVVTNGKKFVEQRGIRTPALSYQHIRRESRRLTPEAGALTARPSVRWWILICGNY